MVQLLLLCPCLHVLTTSRPKDHERINLDGGPANPDEPFDYNAVPTRFGLNVREADGD